MLASRSWLGYLASTMGQAESVSCISYTHILWSY